MSKTETKELDVQWISLQLIERFMNVLFPIEISVLLRLLPTLGYIVPNKRLKGVIEPGEALAVKGNIELLLSPENKTLGVEGRDISETISGFNELRTFWVDKLNPEPPAETHYVEIVANGIVKSSENPSKTINHFWAGFDRLQRLNKIIGFDVSNFGLHLVTNKMEPNNPEWFDISIQPQIVSSANHYYVNVIWRTKDLNQALENFKNLSDILGKLVHEIESK
jgi:hypothetical protein